MNKEECESRGYREYVEGHRRKDGTWVNGFCRTKRRNQGGEWTQKTQWDPSPEEMKQIRKEIKEERKLDDELNRGHTNPMDGWVDTETERARSYARYKKYKR